MTPNPYVIAMTLSVLEDRLPIASLSTVSAAFCVVPKCPRISAKMSTH